MCFIKPRLTWSATRARYRCNVRSVHAPHAVVGCVGYKKVTCISQGQRNNREGVTLAGGVTGSRQGSYRLVRYSQAPCWQRQMEQTCLTALAPRQHTVLQQLLHRSPTLLCSSCTEAWGTSTWPTARPRPSWNAEGLPHQQPHPLPHHQPHPLPHYQIQPLPHPHLPPPGQRRAQQCGLSSPTRYQTTSTTHCCTTSHTAATPPATPAAATTSKDLPEAHHSRRRRCP